ncbi:MAG TPA: hypothetical protein VNO70_27405, partial [Blastocatellia bacterium]|nr:hypothetical protein [Blastocatellia bacterium]
MGRNISIHKGRKSLSAKQVSGGFAFFIVSLLLSGISFSFPSGTNTAQASRSGKQLTELEGTIIVQHEDGPDWSRTVYFLDTGGEQVRLKFRDESVALRAGARVSVRGKLRHGVLKVKNAAADLRVTEGLLALASRPVGEQRALVMLFNFQDNPGHKPWAADAIRNLFFNTVNQFYKEASYNATWISGDFTGWYTLPIASTDCAADKRAAAEAGARALGFEPNNYARKVYIYPRQGCNSWAGLTINYLNSAGFKSEIWINGYADFKTLAHEYGHSLGFAHSASYTCNGGVLAGTCTRSEYGDRYDVMGNTSTGYVNAAHRDDAGWFTAGMPMIEQVTEDGVYTIGPLEAMDGNLKALKIFKSIDPATGLANYYYLEFRQAIGYDSYLSSYPAITGGVLFHLALAPKDTSLFYDCKLLDMTPGTSGADQALGVGRSYTDPDIPVTISVLSANSAGATVSVQFGVPECARSNPAVVMNPVSAGPVAAGMPVNYTVTVSNHDSSACAASSFNLLA